MRTNTKIQIKTPNTTSIFFSTKKSALCENKEFFYSKEKRKLKIKRQKNITETEYKEALIKLEIMETYFKMTEEEKKAYNQNIEIVKGYLSQTK